MKKSTKSTIIIALSVIVSLSMTVVVSKSAEPEWYTIGTVCTKTGAGAAWGITFCEGINAELELINERGGFTIGGKKYFLKTTNEEDKYSATGGRAAVEKLIFREKAKFILGPISSSSAAAAAPIVEKNKVIMFPNCSTPKVFNRFVFKGFTPTSIMVRQFIHTTADMFPDVKRWAWLMTDDETGHATY